ncbi:MAG: LemA family protein [Nonlabens sp.]
MKKLGVGGIIAIVVVLLLGYGVIWYNGTVGIDENVDRAWANVESSYQRRSDLIPNIVATAQEYAQFEKSTLTEITEARASAAKIELNADDLSPEKLETFTKAQGKLNQGLGRLLATFENYPNLKANENFRELINELSRTENRINTERVRYNEAVTSLNVRVKRFPGVLFAGIAGFDSKPLFEADEGADVAPKVKELFNN